MTLFGKMILINKRLIMHNAASILAKPAPKLCNKFEECKFTSVKTEYNSLLLAFYQRLSRRMNYALRGKKIVSKSFKVVFFNQIYHLDHV